MEQVEALRDRAEQEAGKLNEFWERITQSNEPRFCRKGVRTLHEIGKYPALNVQGEFAHCWTLPNWSALSIPKAVSLKGTVGDSVHVTHGKFFTTDSLDP